MSTSLCISVALHTHSSASHVAAVGDGAGASPITTCSWNMAVPLTSMMSVSSFPSSVFAWNCTFDSKLAVALAITSSNGLSPRMVLDSRFAVPSSTISLRLA